MSSFYGNGGYYSSSEGGGSNTPVTDYNSLTNKPILNLVGVTSQPIIFSNLSYGNYVLSGFYKFNENDQSKQENGQRCLQVYQDKETKQKIVKFETVEKDKYYLNFIKYDKNNNYTIEKFSPAKDFITTTKEFLDSIEVKDGQLIFLSDSKEIFLDSKGERQEYGNFIFLPTEEYRISIPYPIEGFYFVDDTNILWRYFKKEWLQITYKPAQQIEFLSFENFPRVGEENKLYISNQDIYRWMNGSYQKIGSSYWIEL